MGLKRKFILRNVALLVGLCVLGAAALWGVSGLRRDVATAVYVYDQLAMIEPAEVKLAVAAGKLAGEVDRAAAGAALDDAIAALSTFTQPIDPGSADRDAAPATYTQQKLAAAGVLARVRAVRAAVDLPEADRPADWGAQRGELAGALEALHAVVRDCDDLVRSERLASVGFIAAGV
jgi:hypothetical protein